MKPIPWSEIVTFTAMDWAKVVISAIILVLASKIQLVNDRLSAMVIALPLTSLMAMIWMHQSGQSEVRLANHAEGTFWFVLPTMPMFLVLPWLLRHGWRFWPALGVNCLMTIGLFWLMVVVLRRFGVDLLP